MIFFKYLLVKNLLLAINDLLVSSQSECTSECAWKIFRCVSTIANWLCELSIITCTDDYRDVRTCYIISRYNHLV